MAWIAVFAGVMTDAITSGNSQCSKKEQEKAPENSPRPSPQLPTAALTPAAQRAQLSD